MTVWMGAEDITCLIQCLPARNEALVWIPFALDGPEAWWYIVILALGRGRSEARKFKVMANLESIRTCLKTGPAGLLQVSDTDVLSSSGFTLEGQWTASDPEDQVDFMEAVPRHSWSYYSNRSVEVISPSDSLWHPLCLCTRSQGEAGKARELESCCRAGSVPGQARGMSASEKLVTTWCL